MVASKIARRIRGEEPVEIVCCSLVQAKDKGKDPTLEPGVLILGRSLEYPDGAGEGTRQVAHVLISLAQ